MREDRTAPSTSRSRRPRTPARARDFDAAAESASRTPCAPPRSRARPGSRSVSSASRAWTSSSSASGRRSGRVGSPPHRRAEGAGQLEREERVPARGFVQAKQCRPCEHPAEPPLQDPVQRAETERADVQTLVRLSSTAARARTPRCRHRAGGRGECGCSVLAVASAQRQERSPTTDPATGRRRSQPGSARARRAAAARSGRPRPGCGSRPARPRRPGAAAHLERAPPRGSQLGQHVGERVLEQVSQPGMGDAELDLAQVERTGRAARAPAPPRPRRARSSTCRSRPRPPGRAPPGLRSLAAEEAVERPQLLVAADDLDWHLLPVIVTRQRRKVSPASLRRPSSSAAAHVTAHVSRPLERDLRDLSSQA